MHGWAGKILKVNLTDKTIVEEPTIPKYSKFIGGSGIGFKVMWDEVPPEAGAFDPENRIVFATGPLVGSEVPGATRTLVVSKSPQGIRGPRAGEVSDYFKCDGGPLRA